MGLRLRLRLLKVAEPSNLPSRCRRIVPRAPGKAWRLRLPRAYATARRQGPQGLSKSERPTDWPKVPSHRIVPRTLHARRGLHQPRDFQGQDGFPETEKGTCYFFRGISGNSHFRPPSCSLSRPLGIPPCLPRRSPDSSGRRRVTQFPSVLCDLSDLCVETTPGTQIPCQPRRNSGHCAITPTGPAKSKGKPGFYGAKTGQGGAVEGMYGARRHCAM